SLLEFSIRSSNSLTGILAISFSILLVFSKFMIPYLANCLLIFYANYYCLDSLNFPNRIYELIELFYLKFSYHFVYAVYLFQLKNTVDEFLFRVIDRQNLLFFYFVVF